MSSSKGRGTSAPEMLDILPPELLRFLMVKTNINQAINFDPSGDTIPKLFDEYQEYAASYFENKKDDYARIFELSQVGELKRPPTVRFSHLAQWVQMPYMEEEIKEAGAQAWVPYARVWLEKYAPESEKFLVQETLPEQAQELSIEQREYLKKVAEELKKEWKAQDFQNQLYEWGKEKGLPSKEAFAALYISLIGKDHGPRAGWLVLSLDREFVKKRFSQAASLSLADRGQEEKGKIKKINKPELFSINKTLKEKFPSVSVGVAIIKNVSIEKTNLSLEKDKKTLLASLENLTTEELGEYPEIQSYRKLYKEMGIDWHSRRPSPEALLRRVALKKGLYTINTCVDAYNLIVMKYRISIGAFDLDEIQLPTELRFAKEGEEILLLGDKEMTKYKEGEIAYFDQTGGFNIDFNYRDAIRTAVQNETKNIYINVDGVFDITPYQVERSLKEACDIIIKYCGGNLVEFGVVA